MRKAKLSKQERTIEKALLKGEYADIASDEFDKIARAIVSRKKDAVLNLRINGKDLANIRKKAKKFGIKYQTFIAEIIHRAAL